MAPPRKSSGKTRRPSRQRSEFAPGPARARAAPPAVARTATPAAEASSQADTLWDARKGPFPTDRAG